MGDHKRDTNPDQQIDLHEGSGPAHSGVHHASAELSLKPESCPEPSSRPYLMGAKPASGHLRLHLNEFRFAHHESVENAFKQLNAGACLTEYPIGIPTSLIAAIANYTDLHTENIIVGAGSDEVLKAIVGSAARAGIKHAVGCVPTYTHFITFVEQAGMIWNPIFTGLNSTHDDREQLLKLESDILERGSLVYLVSPNNPTGDTWTGDTVSKLAKQYPRSIFIVDEAYVEFESAGIIAPAAGEFVPDNVGAAKVLTVSAKSQMNCASLGYLVLNHNNVVVARTFSKAFGLAGLRIGFGLAAKVRAATINTFINPKSVTAVASACAEACLQPDALSHYLDCAKRAVLWRKQMVDWLVRAGWRALPGGGNFMLVFVGNAKEFATKLEKVGIHVRDRSDLPALEGYVRITAGTEHDCAAVLGCFRDLAISTELRPIPETPKALIVRLRQHLAIARKILDKHKITWWACDGTLLGAMRSGGMIRWDDDIDIGYVFDADPTFQSEFRSPAEIRKSTEFSEFSATQRGDPLAMLVDEFKSAGLTLQRNRTNAYWQLGINLPLNSPVPVHECIDLFPFHYDEKSKFYLNADPRFRVESKSGAECNTRYTHEDLFPLRCAKFYNGMIPVPAKAQDVLTRALGAEWETKGIIRDSKGGAIGCTIVDKSPA